MPTTKLKIHRLPDFFDKSLREVARKTQISYPMISAIFRGTRSPSRASVIAIGKCFKVRPTVDANGEWEFIYECEDDGPSWESHTAGGRKRKRKPRKRAARNDRRK